MSPYTSHQSHCGKENPKLRGSFSTFTRRSVPVPSLRRQQKPIIWCARGTQTYIAITIISPFPGDVLAPVLYTSLSQIDINIRNNLKELRFDRVIGQSMQYTVGGVGVETWDANDHRTTWGVLQAAVSALVNFVEYFGLNVNMIFDTYDGANQIGSGNVTWVGKAPEGTGKTCRTVGC